MCLRHKKAFFVCFARRLYCVASEAEYGQTVQTLSNAGTIEQSDKLSQVQYSFAKEESQKPSRYRKQKVSTLPNHGKEQPSTQVYSLWPELCDQEAQAQEDCTATRQCIINVQYAFIGR